MEKETALVEAILFLESEPLSEEAISIIGQLSKDVVEIALENLNEGYYISLDYCIKNVMERGKEVHPQSILALEAAKEQR